MSTLNSIARIVYLLCLTVTLIVAVISWLSGAGFHAMITRMALTLVSSGVLGWTAILVLLPAISPLSEGRTAAGDRPSAAASPSKPDPASVEGGQADARLGETDEEGREGSTSA